MVVRVVILAVVIAGALVFLQQHQVLENAGLTGYCSKVAAPRGQDGFWHECRPGTLTGTPELSKASCDRAGSRGKVELWRCPTPLQQNTAR